MNEFDPIRDVLAAPATANPFAASFAAAEEISSADGTNSAEDGPVQEPEPAPTTEAPGCDEGEPAPEAAPNATVVTMSPDDPAIPRTGVAEMPWMLESIRALGVNEALRVLPTEETPKARVAALLRSRSGSIAGRSKDNRKFKVWMAEADVVCLRTE